MKSRTVMIAAGGLAAVVLSAQAQSIDVGGKSYASSAAMTPRDGPARLPPCPVPR